MASEFNRCKQERQQPIIISQQLAALHWNPLNGMDVDLVSSYAGLLGLAVVSIYAGAFGSLSVSHIYSA